MAFTRWRVAVFVDGVFWHGHPDHFKPETASPYWRDKIARNQERDLLADDALAAQGWTVVRLWDLEVKAQPNAAAGLVVAALRDAGWPGRAAGSTAGRAGC
jgi:DNA mismatch endonuclease (patch repair protein)